MSAAKNMVEGLISLCEHINATHFKIGITQASLIGEFTEDELRRAHEKIERARFRLMCLQNLTGKAVETLASIDQLDLLTSTTLQESSAALARNHRSNGNPD